MLPIPLVLRPAQTDKTTECYDIVQKEAVVGLLPGKRTAIWGDEGMFPGPTIKVWAEDDRWSHQPAEYSNRRSPAWRLWAPILSWELTKRFGTDLHIRRKLFLPS